MDWKIPLFKMYWDEEDVKSVTSVIRRGMFWAIGPNVEQLEKQLSEYLGIKYAAVFSSGTAALHAILLAYDIGPGDEVIVPSFTFIATANAPLFVGAKPVFADIEDKTFGLDPADIKRKITPRTKAIITVHFAGWPCMINELKQIADNHNLLLIEDAAESLGATVSEKKVGTFGNSAILSFCSNKVITTGEGGAVVTDEEEIFEKIKLIRSHGRAETANFFSTNEYMDYITLGYNFRMSDITAAIGVAQMNKIDNLINMRRMNTHLLSDQIADISQIEIPVCPENYYGVYQMYNILVKDGKKARDALCEFLANEGIMSKVYFYPVHLSYFYRNKLGYTIDLPVTENVSQKILALPMYPHLTRTEIGQISRTIHAFFNYKAVKNE